MSSPFTVFHIDGERGFRGGERQLLYLAAALRRRGHENVVVCRSGSELATQSARAGFETLPLPMLCEWEPLSAARLAAAAKRRARPMLHAHTAHAASFAALGSALAGLPSVAHRRVDFKASGLSVRLKYEKVGRVIAVSEAIARLLIEAGLPRARVAVVPDAVPVGPGEAEAAGVGAGRFSPPDPDERARHREALAKEFNFDREKRWIGNLAALVPHKDHENLLAAALIVLLKRNDVLFMIAGKGPEEEKLFGQIQRMGLVGKLYLIGHRSDPVAVLKALDLFVLSSWGEGMGSVLLEAAACGLPIAATKAGGIPELIADGNTGLLAPIRDPESLARNVDLILNDTSLANRLKTAGLARLSEFSLEAQAKRTLEVYDSVA